MVAACERVGVPLDRIEDIAAGCVNPAHEGMGDIARWAALAAGFPDSVPAITVNRFCASSLSGAISDRARDPQRRARRRPRRGRRVDVAVGLGVDEGRCAVHAAGPGLHARHDVGRRRRPAEPALLARDAYIEMMQTAQNVADRYELTREEIDAFALRSHQHAAAARDSGRLAKEIHPVEIAATRKSRRGSFEHDERSAATPAPRSSPRCRAAEDDADDRRQLLAAERRRQRGGARQRRGRGGARRRAAGARRRVGDATRSTRATWGSRPRSRSRRPSQRAGLAPTEIDVWEVHEAYAAQALGVLRELPNQLDGFEVPDERLNPNGGAVAIGHPFGSSGTRYVLTLATELRERGALRRPRRVRRLRPGRRAGLENPHAA